MSERSEAQRPVSVWRYGENTMEPLGPVAIITQQLQPSLADLINRKLRNRRRAEIDLYPDLSENPGYLRSDYRIDVDLKRFKTGEGKATLLESVRGHDLYIISDVINRGTYSERFNELNSLSPDDHYQDLIRLITATHGLCRRVNVVMPYLYEGRRYLRMNRGSMDCATMLRQLFQLGVSNFITFDAHDGRVANAVPRNNFESFPTALQIIDQVLTDYPDLQLDEDHFMVISPKETGITRAVYYATLMKVPLGTFYRIHKTPTEISKGFLGDDVKDKDVMIVDDMIDTGQTVVECAQYLKEQGARRVIAVATFGQFTEGFEAFNQAHDFGILDKVFATNLTYQPRVLSTFPWFSSVDMSDSIATLIDALNQNASLSTLLAPEKRIFDILNKHRQCQETATSQASSSAQED